MLFGPKSAEEIKKKIKELEEKLEKLERKKEDILNQIKEIGKTNKNPTIIAVSNRLIETEREYFGLERKMGIEMIEALENAGSGIVDVTKFNPDIVRKYKEIKRDLDELKKQARYLEKLSKRKDMSRVHALNNTYNGITREIEKTNEQLFHLKRALKK